MSGHSKMEMETRLPRCSECGGKVELAAKSGRTREYRRGVRLDVPADFKIPTCLSCGEEFMSAEISSRLDAILHPVLMRRQVNRLRSCVQVLKTRHDVTQQQIEDACGVTRSYLSHLLSGKREASTTLMRLLEAFAVSDDAFENAREGVEVLDWERQFRMVFSLRPAAQKYHVAHSVAAPTADQRPVRYVEREALPSLAS